MKALIAPMAPRRSQVAVLMAAALLSACSLAPDYEPPTAPAAAPVFKEQLTQNDGNWQLAQPSDAAPRGAWWEVFGDPALNDLQARLSTASQDLRAAVARYEQVRAQAGQSRSTLFPTIGASAAMTRQQTSENAPAAAGAGVIFDNHSASLGLSWEIDLFGRLRNTVAAANRRVEASAGDLAALNLSLQAQLASNYFQLRGADATIGLLQESVEAFERAADLVKHRYEGGIAAATDVAQSESQVESTRAQLAAVRLQRAQFEHAIAVLVGEPASSFTLTPAPFSGQLPVLDPGLPSTLLQRRPDIAAAERAVAAANAEIGVAKAAWFPVFSFSATGGYQAVESHDWFDAPSRFWSIGPSMTAPVIDGGARSAINRRARAAYDEAVAGYRQAVLVAYQEVEDNLAALNHLQEEATRSEAASQAAQRSVFHANKRYAAGVADYLEVATTQTNALTLQRSALDARVRRVVAGVDLVRATGGGWTRDQLERAGGGSGALAKAEGP